MRFFHLRFVTCFATLSMLLTGCQVAISSPSPIVPTFVDNTVFVQCRGDSPDAPIQTGNCTPRRGRPNELGVNTCGVGAIVCVARWKFAGTTELGDVYSFTVSLPASDGTAAQVVEKDVIYEGKEIIIYQDDFRKVGMGPLPLPTTSPAARAGQ